MRVITVKNVPNRSINQQKLRKTFGGTIQKPGASMMNIKLTNR